jgi:hypothetical protein
MLYNGSVYSNLNARNLREGQMVSIPKADSLICDYGLVNVGALSSHNPMGLHRISFAFLCVREDFVPLSKETFIHFLTQKTPYCYEPSIIIIW